MKQIIAYEPEIKEILNNKTGIVIYPPAAMHNTPMLDLLWSQRDFYKYADLEITLKQTKTNINYLSENIHIFPDKKVAIFYINIA